MKSHQEMAAAEPALHATWFNAPHLMRFPGGKSLQELVSRAADAVRLVLARHPAGTVVMVSYDSVIRALLLQFADLPLPSYWRLTQEPCCINEIEVTGHHIRVLAINETAHLDRINPA